ncbi:peptidase M16 [Bodo saltans virus]|uniref:Peptidase M16 n=1 Tax=Bodo saltans virus TaxID=2024608 RepID=A0A2H4UVM3_9VIRU|nr:peptidase M16 [Bodo saltans virus]ATZ80906.1 peptidase M16 [Bodo saltans virus]
MQNIFKSPKDERDGVYFTLNNKLNVIFINDKKCDMACVGMLVKVGYLNDTVAGIAHFLEHMLFNGTKKYPDEQSFSAFISQHNGYQNAYTSHDHTCYYFSVVEDGLKTGLDMFCDFFVEPLLSKNCVEREKEAVNSEHLKNINNDDWRSYELIKVAIDEKHPFTKFGTGSNETLNIDNIEVYVKDFFDKYYSSDIMTLVIITKQNINELKNLITENFEKIQNKNRKDVYEYTDTPILKKNKLIKYLPIENNYDLTLFWEIPWSKNNSYQCILNFIVELINKETKDSLHDILSKNGYAVKFECCIREIFINRCILVISISLSPHGIKFKREIIGTIIECINLIKSKISSEDMKNIYDENRKIEMYTFLHFEKKQCIDEVQQICTIVNDNNISLEYIFMKNIMGEPYSDNVIKIMETILDALNLDNIVILSGSNEYAQENMKEYKHYGTKYNISDVKIEYKHIVAKSKFPKINKFLSTNDKEITKTIKMPLKYIDNKLPFISYWYPYVNFKVPDVNIYCKITIPNMVDNVYNYVCMVLYINSILTEINTNLALCKDALYDIRIKIDVGYLYINVNGNYEKIPHVCKYLTNKLEQYQLISDNSFNTAKFTVTKAAKNEVYDQPYDKLGNIFKKIMSKYHYDGKDILTVIDTINKNDMIENFKKIYYSKKITLFSCGNCNDILFNELRQVFNNMLEKNNSIEDKRIYNIVSTSIKQNIINENIIEENNGMSLYLYIGNYNYEKFSDWAKNVVLLSILDNFISSDYFDNLRTKEMFGYIVTSRIVVSGDSDIPSYFYNFMIQSPNKTTKQCIERTEKFINDYNVFISNLTNEKIELSKNAYIDTLKSNFNNLVEYSQFVFLCEIDNKYEKYDYRELLIEKCKSINKNDIMQFYNKYFYSNNEKITILLNKQNENKKNNVMTGGCVKNCMCNHRMTVQ